MRKISIIIIILSSLLLVSCKSYLDLKPYGKTIPKTAEEYSAMIHNMLNDIEQEKDGAYIMPNTHNVIFWEAISDNLDANIYLGKEVIPYYVGGVVQTPIYGRLYQSIRDCNIVLDGLKDDKSADAQKVLSTAYAIRGVCYYELLKFYCKPVVGGVYPELGMPIVQTFDMEARPIRSSYETTVKLIEEDFDKALSYNMNDKVYLFTADVVKAYKAKLYHWTAQWSKAAEISMELLDKYRLLTRDEYAKIVLGTSTFSNMILRYKASMQQGDVIDRVYRSLRNRPVSRDFIDIFDNAQKDIRYKESINVMRNPIKLFMGTIRPEEMLLICAESKFYLNKKDEALQLINRLRANRFENYTPLTMESIPQLPNNSPVKVDAMGNQLTPLSQLIINERRKELFMEGDRFTELKRLGSPEFWVTRDGLVYTTKKFMYTFPIPVADILINNGIIQNEGYIEFINN